MKQLKKLYALAAAVLIGAATLAVPVTALDINPYEVYCNSEGKNAVSIAFKGLNTSVKAFQISFELDDLVEPKSVTWGSQIGEKDLKVCDYDKATNTLNLYVVSDKNLVVNNQLEIGTIHIAANSDAPAKGQYKMTLKAPSAGGGQAGNIVFVDNTNQTMQSASAPVWQGETTFTYEKNTSSGGGSGGSIGGSGGGSGGTSNKDPAKDKDKNKDKNTSKPVEPILPPEPPIGTPVVTTPVTTGGISTAPIEPTVSSSVPETTSSESVEEEPQASEPEPVEETQAEPETKPEAKKFPILPVAIASISLIVVAAVIVLKVKHVF